MNQAPTLQLDPKEDTTFGQGLFVFLFAIATDIVRAIVIAFVFNLLVAPAFALPTMTVLVAYGIDMLFTMLTSPQNGRLAMSVKETAYRPAVNPQKMVEYLKLSAFKREVATVAVLLIQALLFAGIAYFLV